MLLERRQCVSGLQVDQFDVGRREPGVLQLGQDVTMGGAPLADGDALALEVRDRRDGRIRVHQHLIADPGALSGLPAQAARDLKHGLIIVAVRALAAVAACGLLLGLAVFRRRVWLALASAGVSLAVLAGSGGIAAATWNPRSIFEPRYTGLLAGAPSLVGNVQDIAVRFGLYRQELAGLVTNVTRLYAATSDLPVYRPDPGTIRVLDVSDIHDNPAAWDVMHSIARQFAVSFVIDSGDLTDHGTGPDSA